jgi:hypothetical protein
VTDIKTISAEMSTNQDKMEAMMKTGLEEMMAKVKPS